MGRTELDEIYIFEISIKILFFDVSIGIKIPFFRVSVTIEPGRSLLTVRYHELFDNISFSSVGNYHPWEKNITPGEKKQKNKHASVIFLLAKNTKFHIFAGRSLKPLH
jgi:hypothetical protein